MGGAVGCQVRSVTLKWKGKVVLRGGGVGEELALVVATHFWLPDRRRELRSGGVSGAAGRISVPAARWCRACGIRVSLKLDDVVVLTASWQPQAGAEVWFVGRPRGRTGVPRGLEGFGQVSPSHGGAAAI